MWGVGVPAQGRRPVPLRVPRTRESLARRDAEARVRRGALGDGHRFYLRRRSGPAEGRNRTWGNTREIRA